MVSVRTNADERLCEQSRVFAQTLVNVRYRA